MSTALHAPCDAAVARCAEAREGKAHPGLVLATTVLASSLAFIDGSVVNVGLPAIARSLKADASALQWVINAYLLPLSALLLLGGAAGDRFGQRRLLVAGTALFALASLACALAPSLTLLLSGRFALGVGAAMLMPNSLAILGRNFEGAAKGRAIGAWAASSAVMGAIGPVLGGWLIDVAGWRSIFLINLPIAAVAIGMARTWVPVDPRRGGGRLDALGGALATTGLGALTFGLTAGSGPGGWSPAALGALGLGAGIIFSFVLVEKRLGERAMAPLALFGSKGFAGLTLFTLLLYAALGGLLVLLPYVMIVALGSDPVAAGAALLPLPLVLALFSPVMGALAGKLGARLPLVLSPFVVAAGFLMLLGVGPGASYWRTIFPAILVIALGMAGAVAPLTNAVLDSVDAAHTGSASGLNSAVARTGGLVATALLGSALAAKGPALISAFHGASLIGAATCVAASLTAAALVRR